MWFSNWSQQGESGLNHQPATHLTTPVGIAYKNLEVKFDISISKLNWFVWFWLSMLIWFNHFRKFVLVHGRSLNPTANVVSIKGCLHGTSFSRGKSPDRFAKVSCQILGPWNHPLYNTLSNLKFWWRNFACNSLCKLSTHSPGVLSLLHSI